MGMYDEVSIRCPNCKQYFIFQSKCGPKRLESFSLDNAPLFVIADINEDGENGKLWCEHCDSQIKVKVRFTVKVESPDCLEAEDYREV